MDTTWQKVSKWYDESVGEKGHFYHREVVIPNLLRLMKLSSNDRVLDVACGQGVLARNLPGDIEYVGLDFSKSLLLAAKKLAGKNQQFILADVTLDFPKDLGLFTQVCVVLALQNLEKPQVTLREITNFLDKNGRVFLVLNHPVLRIPQQSSWGWDQDRRIQYRRIDSYLSSAKVAITAHPGDKISEKTFSFHWSLQDLAKMFAGAGLMIEKIEEWISPKKSEGGRAKEEDRSRKEIPLFMAIVLRKA